jgi:hypothetical protein
MAWAKTMTGKGQHAEVTYLDRQCTKGIMVRDTETARLDAYRQRSGTLL